MKVTESLSRVAAVGLSFVLLMASCSTDNQNASPPATTTPDAALEPAPSADAATPPPAAEATSTPAPISDDQRIEAVLAQLEADVSTGAINDVAYYDVLDSAVAQDGSVTVTICAWNGDSAFDQVRDSIYRTAVDANSEVSANHISTPIAPGDCLNQQLINSALDHIDRFQLYWNTVLADPASFETNPPGNDLITESFRDLTTPQIDSWVSDGIYMVPAAKPPVLVRVAAVNEILYRRQIFNGQDLLEIVLCRNADPEHGIYRGETLLDDFQPANGVGPHLVSLYQLSPFGDGEWLTTGTDGLVWADCLQVDDWVVSAGEWKVGPDPFRSVPS